MHSVSQLLTNKKHWNETDFGTQCIKSVHAIGQAASVLEAARLMNEHRIGSLVVTDPFGELVGIISERDILVRVVTAQRDPTTTQIRDVMTRNVISCCPETSLNDVRRIMTLQHIRHLPVVDNGSLVGMISIGDLNAAMNAELSIEVKAMRQYITNC